jgi:hypothetical protein
MRRHSNLICLKQANDLHYYCQLSQEIVTFVFNAKTPFFCDHGKQAEDRTRWDTVVRVDYGYFEEFTFWLRINSGKRY